MNTYFEEHLRTVTSGSNENVAYFRIKEINVYHFCEKLKEQYFSLLNVNKVAINLFWKTVKLFLSNKTTSSFRVTLAGDEDLVTYLQKVAITLKNLFSNVVTTLK